MSELIGGPLTAAGDAQFQLAGQMIQFIKTLAYKDGKEGGDVLTLPMVVERPQENADGSISTMKVTAAPPLLGLVPIPALLVDKVTIDFEMEIKTHQEEKSSSDTSASFSGSASYLFFRVSVKGSVATHRENTRSTDNSAKYTVHVEANQQPPTEGMSKLMDLLAVASEPLKAEPATA